MVVWVEMQIGFGGSLIKYGDIAQLAEQMLHTHLVGSSNLSIATYIKAPWSSG